MSLTLSDVMRSTLLGGLGTLRAVLKAAQEQSPNTTDELLQARLFDDMFTFVQQIQAATDNARRATDRVSGQDPSSAPDPEPTVSALLERVEQTMEHIKKADAAAIDASTHRAMTVNLGAGPMEVTGRSYVLGFVLPNFLFHVTTAYDIMRHRGVKLGKVDYIRPFMMGMQ